MKLLPTLKKHWNGLIGALLTKGLPLLGASVLLCVMNGGAQAAHLKQVSSTPTESGQVVTLYFSGHQPYKHFALTGPERLVIDFSEATLATQLPKLKSNGPIKQLRSGQPKANTLRLVFDLSQKAPVTVKSLGANANGLHRIQLQFKDTRGKAPVASATPSSRQASKSSVAVNAKPLKSDSPRPIPLKTRDFMVAIDPGHGGADPGAIGGHFKTYEKTIVLSISKRLKAKIDATPGMNAFLTRSNDYFVPLRKRIQIARDMGADIFISVHADSFKNTKAKGASVFTLSKNGASSEAAKWLAESENAVDLIGGITLDDKGELLASVLLDLSQTASQAGSQQLAGQLLTQLGRIGPLHQTTIQQAGFAVLKSPDIPSVLVEVGFISDKETEAKLRNSRYQSQVAQALWQGVNQYFNEQPRPVAHKPRQISHTVMENQTLSEIAYQYGINQDAILQRNRLKSTTIRVGQTLWIPIAA